MRFSFAGISARTSSRRRQRVVPIAAEMVESRIVLSPMTGVSGDTSEAKDDVAEQVDVKVADGVQQQVKIHVGAKPVSADHADLDAIKERRDSGLVQSSTLEIGEFKVYDYYGICFVEGWTTAPVGQTDIVLGGVLDGYEIPVDAAGYFIGGFMDVPGGLIEGTAVDEFGNTSDTEVRLYNP